MRYPNFIGGSKASRSRPANNEHTMNWFPEDVGDRLVLYPTPGFTPFLTAPTANCRAMWSENNKTFVVMGNQFLEIVGAAVAVVRGTFGAGDISQPAQIVSNGAVGGQLLIASGGDAYCYTLATGAFTLVLSGEAHMIAMLDGYFLAFNAFQSKMRFSGLNNGLTWNALDFFLRSIAPDNWRAMTVNQGRIWLIGEHTGEVWWDQGGSSIPFAPIQSSVFSFGILARWSLVCVGDTVRWLSQSVDGDGIVVSARGYRPERISDHATEYAISDMKAAGRIDDAEALTYQEAGHTYTALRFPTGKQTRVYDDATQLWHERGYWDPATQTWSAWTPRMHMQAFGKHLVGDASATISAMDLRYTTEVDGHVIRRQRAAPILRGEGERVFADRLELLIEPGVAQQASQVPYAQQVRADGATYYWRLGETTGLVAADSLGPAPGTISGGVTLNQPGALADSNPAMAFVAASGGQIALPALTVALAFSIEAWVRTTDRTQLSQTIFSQRSAVTSLPGQVYFAVTKVGGTVVLYGQSITNSNFTSTRDLADGVWHHVVMTWDSGGAARSYVDGVLDTTAAGTTARTVSVPYAAGIAFDPAGPGTNWNGSLDDIAIYPTVLTPAQIAAHYAARLAPAVVNTAASDPQVSLAISYDGGKTWGNERFVGAGRVGQYTRRLIWTRCGSGGSVQARFTCTDPVPWNLIDCFIDATGIQPVSQRGGGEAAA
jgi:hypothetical protein